jgi:membrane AbrB-like protein
MTAIIVLLFGSAGAFVGHRLPVPAGVLFGTLVGVGGGSALGVLLGLPHLSVPSWVNGLLQIMLGMFVGFRMSRDALRPGAHALIPASLLAAVMIPTAIASAIVVAPLTSIDIVTLLFAAAPGGLTEMSTVSVSFGADGAAVAAVQLVRVLLAVAIVGAVVARLRSKGEAESAPGSEKQDDASAERTGYAEDLKRLGVAAPWGVLGGMIGIISSLPAAGVFGALAGSAAFRLLTERPVPVKKFQYAVQVLAGGVIGLGVSGEFFRELVQLAVAGALIISAQMLLWFVTGWLLVKLFRYDLSTAAIASSPGGMSGVVPAASEVGADVVIVTFIHLVRLNTIIAIVPVFISLVFSR